MFGSIVLVTSLVGVAQAFSRGECQYPTRNPLQGCPHGTLLVGPTSHFKTIQSAILSLPKNNSPYNILILPGNYTEQVNITRPGPLTLFGQTSHANDDTKNTVNIIWHNATGTPSTGSYDNAYTSTLTIAPTLNSSLTGSGPTGFAVPVDTPFGNRDFRAYNLNVINDYLPYSAGPSLALSVSYSNAGFYFCGFYSYQDTIYIGKKANAYIHQSTIAGETDFLYGFGTLWIQSSLLSLRSCNDAGITAWKGTNTTFPNHYGAYIHSSSVIAANASIAAEIKGKCALGRPWNAQHRSIFANTYLDQSILKEGYIQWQPKEPRLGINTTMAEFRNLGPGFDEEGRRKGNVTLVMDWEMYEPYSTVEKVFQFPNDGRFGNTGWIDRKPEVHGK